ncbi:MAG: TIGR03009 domain-containing protein [Planctomycetes bacterium]|nr:TIGR03009 domain-containing protein [Planctomycetota bacterium]
MYRPFARCQAVAFVATILLVVETSPAVGQQAPVGQPPAAYPANPVAAPGVLPAQVGQTPAQLGQPQQTTAPVNRMGPPFQLTPVEKQFVDQILLMWETESAKINTFDCAFERWEYDPVFGPGNNIPMIKSMGQLTYSKPDKGSFKIDDIRRWTKKDAAQETWEPGDWAAQKHEVGEHWVCDGKAVYEYNHGKKQLVVIPLPPEMRGKAIVDGPLPFLFGAEAAKLNNRYWIRSKQGAADTIWLEAYPRHQADAANYHHVDIMLERKTMLPTALQVHMPNGQSRAVYMFKKPTVNGTLNKLFGNIFSAPRTPFGWKRVVQEIPAGAQVAPQAAQPKETKQR